ncbi:NACHT domain-containing protein [Streptomyces radicis]|uniref:NACHT domain-containing protein n=1 Tax=Streptomyces radicis TaxID=1750517 RepID=A0A3A9WBK4_9ACTN|nr:NACHT domain-containing protein [Streptomyces radicis]RKN24384.1 NACHT domain-containing protein [Streptomyces radicis]
MGLRLASAAVAPLVKKLFTQTPPGAGLVDKPVRITALVSFRGEKRTVVERDLTKVAKALVERVEPEGPPLERDEKARIAAELVATLLALGDLTMDDVQAVQLGHRELAARLLAVGEEAGRGRDLPTRGAEELFHGLLDAACLHILDFFTKRSTFVARTLVEQSRRLDRLVRTVDLLVERLGDRTAEDAAFERRYAAYVRGEHGTLTIYGLDLAQSREWPLDDAYLSLETHRPDRLEDGGLAEGAPQRAERALSGLDRVLLRGHAGSGKTTLVQWLAVSATRQDVAEDLEHLVGRVPFVLTMRTLTRAGGPLPDPERFLAAVDCPLVSAQPGGWADRVLMAGRGLLLVDGIDEVPESEREGVRRWLRRLGTTYPGNLWLVTARPSAVREDWLHTLGFTELSLAPMGHNDLHAFVHRWHRAVGAAPEAADALLDLVQGRGDLATLATNPLMCALICALHRERNGYLPRGRKALYDAALSLLLERRDRERPDPPRVDVDLDADTLVSLLQQLANWLIINGRSEMSAEVAVAQLAQSLPLIHRGDRLGPATAVLRHLVERSGVLREPVEGAVDFVHRTFQDYLGARYLVEWHHFPALVAHAHEDQWEDVIRMAVAHAQPVQRAELLIQLVERGDAEPEHRVRLHLVAMACLEHATQLSPDVRAEVTARAHALLPPRTRNESRALAGVGQVVLDLLPGPEEVTDDEADAVVFAATRVGADTALSRLRPFRSSATGSVRHLLSVNWQRFDTRRYFDEILRHLPDDEALIRFARTDEELRLLSGLDAMRNVDLSGDFTEAAIVEALAGHPLDRIALRSCPALHDIAWVDRFPSLTDVLVDTCQGITDLAPLADTGVHRLSLYNDEAPAVMRGLDGLDRLAHLAIGSLTRLETLAELPGAAELDSLTLPEDVPDLGGIDAWPTLTQLCLHFTTRGFRRAEWRAVAALPRLEHLVLHAGALRSLADHGVELPRIRFLQFFPADPEEPIPVDDVARVAAAFPGVTTLLFNTDPADFAPLAALPELGTVRTFPPSARRNVPDHIEVIAPPAPRY